MGLLHLLLQRHRRGEVKINQRDGGKITNQLVDLRMDRLAIEERQVQRKCRGAAPALKGGGKQREQRGRRCDALLLPALFHGLPFCLADRRFEGGEVWRFQGRLNHRQLWR